MKTLIHNYSSATSSEPMYFTKCLELCETPVHLWSDQNISAFDMFDAVQPDVFITHYTFMTNDIVKYLSQHKKIKTVLNLSGANEQEMETIEQVFVAGNIDVPFVFTNMHDCMYKNKPRGIKMVNIWPSADIFLPPSAVPDFEIDLAVVATDMTDLVKRATESKDTYHLLSLGKDNEEFDLSTNIQILRGMYDKYNEVLITSDISVVFSQVLFEAALNAKKLSIKVSKDQQGMLDKILASLFHDDGNDNVARLVKRQIERKHTCVNRTSRLCKFLKNTDAVKKLDKLGEQICAR